MLLILGDICDRGKKSYEIYMKCMKMIKLGYNLKFILGNHEDMFNLALKEARYNVLDSRRQDHYFRNNGLITLQSFYPEATIENRRYYFKKFAREYKKLRLWLKKLQTRYESWDYYFVHAGVDFNKNFWNQEHRDIVWIREPYLSSDKKYDKKIFHGHSPVREEPYYDIRENRINIDGGCVYGGKLNIVIINEDGSILFQQSKQLEEDIYK